MISRRLGVAAVVFVTLASLIAGPLPSAVGVEQDGTGGMTVSPATGLVDRQVVTVDISAVQSYVWTLLECRTGARVTTECDRSDTGAYAGQGRTVPLRVDAEFREGDGSVIDCRRTPGACSIVAVSDIGVGDPIDGYPSVPLNFKPHSPLAAAPTVSVRPNRNLRDGQSVALRGHGFLPTAIGTTRLCAAPARTTKDCGRTLESTGQIDTGGNLTSSVVVDPTFSTGDGRIIDCRARWRRCVLTVGDVSDPGDASRTRLRFDPKGPLLPRPTISLDPSQNLLDDRLVTLTGAGFDFGTSRYVSARECPAGYVDRTTCRLLLNTIPSADGHFRQTVVPDATIPDGPRTIDCRTRVGRCVLVVGIYDAEFDEIASLDLAFDPAAPLRPPPMLRTEPATAERAGQAVTLIGSGFRPSTYQLRVTLCAAPAGPTTSSCQYLGQPRVDASGTSEPLSVPFPTEFDPDGPDPPVSCTAKPGACVIHAVSEDSIQEQATLPVSFGPQPPPVRYLDPVFANVDVSHDLVYSHAVNSTGVDQPLHLDLYRPAKDTTRQRPLIIWVHGGYFTSGDKASMSSLATDMAKRGYVSASIEYRLHPTGADIGGAIADAYADAQAAVTWLRQHAADYGINPDRIAIGGFSAGAFTALNVGYAATHSSGGSANVQAVVSIAGGLSIGQPERSEAPALFFHARNDDVVGYEVGESSCARIQAAGPGCSLFTYQGIQHGYPESDVANHTADFLDDVFQLPGRTPSP